ncbi:MAG: ATP-binding protein, partial [Bacillota bacterium]
RLQQVFWNLLNNATKFTPTGGRITLRTRNAILADDSKPDGSCPTLIVEVCDSGIGIESDCLPRLFQAFEQGERSITRRFGGLGLGLTISKALIDAQGGQLTAASAGPNQGATFTIQLPTVPSSFIQPSTPDSVLPDYTISVPHLPLRILLVEDHQDTAHIMARLLGGLGHEVQTAPGVGKALELAQLQRFDLLISDIGLPDGSGLELMRTLRQRSSIRGIALSGFGMEMDLVQSKEAGFVEHLIKPINFQKLESVIARVAACEETS